MAEVRNHQEKTRPVVTKEVILADYAAVKHDAYQKEGLTREEEMGSYAKLVTDVAVFFQQPEVPNPTTPQHRQAAEIARDLFHRHKERTATPVAFFEEVEAEIQKRRRPALTQTEVFKLIGLMSRTEAYKANEAFEEEHKARTKLEHLSTSPSSEKDPNQELVISETVAATEQKRHRVEETVIEYLRSEPSIRDDFAHLDAAQMALKDIIERSEEGNPQEVFRRVRERLRPFADLLQKGQSSYDADMYVRANLRQYQDARRVATQALEHVSSTSFMWEWLKKKKLVRPELLQSFDQLVDYAQLEQTVRALEGTDKQTKAKYLLPFLQKGMSASLLYSLTQGRFELPDDFLTAQIDAFQHFTDVAKKPAQSPSKLALSVKQKAVAAALIAGVLATRDVHYYTPPPQPPAEVREQQEQKAHERQAVAAARTKEGTVKATPPKPQNTTSRAPMFQRGDAEKFLEELREAGKRQEAVRSSVSQTGSGRESGSQGKAGNAGTGSSEGRTASTGTGSSEGSSGRSQGATGETQGGQGGQGQGGAPSEGGRTKAQGQPGRSGGQGEAGERSEGGGEQASLDDINRQKNSAEVKQASDRPTSSLRPQNNSAEQAEKAQESVLWTVEKVTDESAWGYYKTKTFPNFGVEKWYSQDPRFNRMDIVTSSHVDFILRKSVKLTGRYVEIPMRSDMGITNGAIIIDGEQVKSPGLLAGQDGAHMLEFSPEDVGKTVTIAYGLGVIENAGLPSPSDWDLKAMKQKMLEVSDFDQRDREFLESVRALPTAQRAQKVVEYIQETFLYSLNEDLNDYYNVGKGKDFIKRIFNLRKTDCDVANTAAAAALRAVDLPTRLVLGYGRNGAFLNLDETTFTGSEFHAWVEVFDEETQSWISLDATPGRGDSYTNEAIEDINIRLDALFEGQGLARGHTGNGTRRSAIELNLDEQKGLEMQVREKRMEELKVDEKRKLESLSLLSWFQENELLQFLLRLEAANLLAMGANEFLRRRNNKLVVKYSQEFTRRKQVYGGDSLAHALHNLDLAARDTHTRSVGGASRNMWERIKLQLQQQAIEAEHALRNMGTVIDESIVREDRGPLRYVPLGGEIGRLAMRGIDMAKVQLSRHKPEDGVSVQPSEFPGSVEFLIDALGMEEEPVIRVAFQKHYAEAMRANREEAQNVAYDLFNDRGQHVYVEAKHVNPLLKRIRNIPSQIDLGEWERMREQIIGETYGEYRALYERNRLVPHTREEFAEEVTQIILMELTARQMEAEYQKGLRNLVGYGSSEDAEEQSASTAALL